MGNPFKGRHFQAEIILICTRWYLRYALSYRNIEEMMTERGLISGSHDHLPLGSKICARTRQTEPTLFEANQ